MPIFKVSSTKSSFPLESLPTELILSIAEKASSARDLLHLAMANTFLYNLLAPRLIMINIKSHRASGLNYAVRKNNLLLAAIFIDAGADVNKRAIGRRQAQKLQKSMRTTAELSALRSSGKLDTPLYAAVSNGFEHMVVLLLAYGADPRTAAHRGYPSALAKAAYDVRERIAKILVEALRSRGVPMALIMKVANDNFAMALRDRGLI
ncbi:hypothetical protein BDW71DRAFT_192791 [Aspergillus fruticulosus]